MTSLKEYSLLVGTYIWQPGNTKDHSAHEAGPSSQLPVLYNYCGLRQVRKIIVLRSYFILHSVGCKRHGSLTY